MDEVGLPLRLVLLALPVAVVVVLRRRREGRWRPALASVGIRSCPAGWYLWAPAGVAGGLALAAVALQVVPPEALSDARLVTPAYQGLPLTLGTALLVLGREAVYTALGEELLFRGLLGGWLTRRLEFSAGNALQAAASCLLYLPLLGLGSTLWILVAAWFVAGWLLGWLRHESGSIWPGWVAHSLASATVALVVAF